jgi:hypothetical protein
MTTQRKKATHSPAVPAPNVAQGSKKAVVAGAMTPAHNHRAAFDGLLDAVSRSRQPAPTPKR